jgi:hypothetical protein
MSEIKRCPICKRNKNQAIQEQSAKKEHCRVAGCVFSKQIIEAIQKKIIPAIVKKPTKNIVVIKKETKTIKINKK